MPKGSPSAQTIASEKYQKKAGYMVKGFKIKRETAEAFEAACEKAGVSQASQITRMIQQYTSGLDYEDEKIASCCEEIENALKIVSPLFDRNYGQMMNGDQLFKKDKESFERAIKRIEAEILCLRGNNKANMRESENLKKD